MRQPKIYQGMIRKEWGGWIVEGIGGSFRTKKLATKRAKEMLRREYISFGRRER